MPGDKQDHGDVKTAKPLSHSGFVNLKAAKTSDSDNRAFRVDKKGLAELPFHRVKDVECYPLPEGMPKVDWNRRRSRETEAEAVCEADRPLSPTSELLHQLESIAHQPSQSPQPVSSPLLPR